METVGKARGNRPLRRMRRNQILRFPGSIRNPTGPIFGASCQGVAGAYPKAWDNFSRQRGTEVA